MQPVHGDGKAGMCLLGNGAVGHGTCLEALYDLLLALYLFERDALCRIVEVQKASEITCLLCIHHGSEFLKLIIVSGTGGKLKHMDGPGIISVIFTLGSCLMPSHCRKGKIRGKSQRIKGTAVLCICRCCDIGKGDSAHPAHRTGEVFVDHILGDTDGFKDLAALVGLDRGDTHLGSDLPDAEKHGPVVIIHCCVIILLQQSVLCQLANGLMGQIRVHCGSTIAQKCCEMMHLAGLAGLQDQRHGGTFPCGNQMLMHCGNCQQGRKGYVVFVNTAVRKDQDIRAFAVSLVHLNKEVIDDPLDGSALVVKDGNLCHREAFLLHMLDLQNIQIRQDGIVDLQHMTVLRTLCQKISVLPQVYAAGGYDLLTFCIDGRVCYLREQLLEIVEQGLVLLGKGSDGRIHTHGSDLLDTTLRHAADALMVILIGITEGLLQTCALLSCIGHDLLVRDLQIMQLQQVGIQPLTVGLLACILLL